ncbi:hypothetical protein J2857_005335 [Neorhizobium galegae]|nr:hypothetical protein [Neorhizobium galegae]
MSRLATIFALTVLASSSATLAEGDYYEGGHKKTDNVDTQATGSTTTNRADNSNDGRKYLDRGDYYDGAIRSN